MPVERFTKDGLSGVADAMLRAAKERQNATQGAVVVGLTGDLGAGKTSLTQALAAKLGVSVDVTSPTFVIEKRYETTDVDFTSLIHIDAYRIEDPKELSVIGFSEQLKEKEVLIIVEWVERVRDLMPQGTLYATLTHIDENTRSISYA